MEVLQRVLLAYHFVWLPQILKNHSRRDHVFENYPRHRLTPTFNLLLVKYQFIN
jgi:hypothetical protein